MFRKLREALKQQRYRVHSDDVALPEVHTGPVSYTHLTLPTNSRV